MYGMNALYCSCVQKCSDLLLAFPIFSMPSNGLERSPQRFAPYLYIVRNMVSILLMYTSESSVFNSSFCHRIIIFSLISESGISLNVGKICLRAILQLLIVVFRLLGVFSSMKSLETLPKVVSESYCRELRKLYSHSLASF